MLSNTITWHFLIRQLRVQVQKELYHGFLYICSIKLCLCVAWSPQLYHFQHVSPPTFTFLDLHLKKQQCHFPPFLLHLACAVQWRSVIVSVWWPMTREWHWSLASPVSPKQIKKRPSCWLNLLKMALVPTSVGGWWKVRSSVSRCTQLSLHSSKMLLSWKTCLDVWVFTVNTPVYMQLVVICFFMALPFISCCMTVPVLC